MTAGESGAAEPAASPWPAGAATGVGSLPGVDIPAAVASVFEELADLPHLPELPARGPGAGLIGRGLAHLVDLHFDLQPSGWRLVPKAGWDERRARDLLTGDLDTLEAFAAAYPGLLKVQLAGPWTLAANAELTRGDRVLADRGAVGDLAGSLAAGLDELLAGLRRRLPRASFVVQVDEPALPQVLAGRIPTASGFADLPAVAEETATARLGEVLAAAVRHGAIPAVHGCAEQFPVGLAARAGATALSLDLTAAADEDELGEFLDRGGRLIAGVVPPTEPAGGPTAAEASAPVRRLWRRLGFAPERLAAQVTVSPTCGLAGASPAWAVTAMRLAAEAARQLAEDPEAAPARGAAGEPARGAAGEAAR